MKKIMAILLVIVLVFGSCYNNHNVAAEQKTQEQNQEERTIQATVKDMSGVKRKLKIDYVQNVGTVIDYINMASDYSQVIDGHYYYMRQMKRNYFSVYQDAGEKIGSFKITDFDVYDECLAGIIKYGAQFYLIVQNYEKETMEIAVVDFDEQNTTILCTISAEDIVDVILYNNEIYCMSSWLEHKVEKYSMNGEKLQTYIFPKQKKKQHLNFINIADGKIYYAVEEFKGKKDKVTFRCRNMETNEDEKVFRCNVQESPSWGNYLIMDGKNLYYWGGYFYYEYENRMKCYSIPLKNGKMEQIGKGKIRNFTYNNKYYFYVDKKYRLHRQNRKTKKDKIISDIKVSGVTCTDAGLYVKKYDSWFDNGGFEWANSDYSKTLYFMDFDGENVKRIAKGKRGHIEY